MKRLTLLLTIAIMSCLAVMAQGKVLVAYFSATGNTERVAKQVATITNGDLHEITPQQAYTSDDLNWHDSQSRSSVEMADENVRPAIVDDLDNIDKYSTIYVGFPIWWNLAPRVINTFIEKYDLSGKKVIPFATSGGSNISNSVKELQKAYPNIKWGNGMLLNRATNDEIKNWTEQ